MRGWPCPTRNALFLLDAALENAVLDIRGNGPYGTTLVELFSSTVSRLPHHPAVRDEERSSTYAEFDSRSTAIAAALVVRGVHRGDRVAVCMRRSTDLVAAILGVLKAGAAYVAVDTRYPQARRELMVRSSGARVVLADAESEKSMSTTASTVEQIDHLASAVRGSTPDVPYIAADDAASVLFTSGSLGTPKAIVLEHRNICSFATNPAMPALTEDDRVGQISSVSFDAFHFEMWSALAAGAEMVILPAVPDLLAADFQRQLRRYRISAMLAPTMVVNHVVREDRDAFAPLRLLQAGGDVLLPSTCRELLASGFGGELYNLYGPAEITTACTAHRVTQEDAGADSIPVGRPLAGVTVRVVDSDLASVRPGEIGELLVGGPGLARGYLGAPELTAERFLVGEDGRRMYRTGDLVREGDDGVLLFVGRADGQVKVRGYRVEPGEIERALRGHTDVVDAVVLPDGGGEDRRLVAFVVLDGGLTVRDVRAHATAELPDYLVPSDFVVLSAMPATEHGKRDLGALRDLLVQQRERAASFREPEGETARFVANVWQEILGVERVGADDDFFELGGHSLHGFRVQRRINRELGVALEPTALLEHSVLSVFAGVVDRLVDEKLAESGVQ